MSYQIVVDSACDLSESRLKELKVIRLPLTVNFPDGKHLPDGFGEISSPDFYEGMRKGVVSTTSQVNTNAFYEAFREGLANHANVFYLGFSSALSGTYQGGVLARNMLVEEDVSLKGRIVLVDSRAASLGYGLLVMEACRKRDEGMGIAELTAYIEQLKGFTNQWITVEDLVYLKRGGRVSAVQASMGSLLNIKPLLNVNNAGALESVGRAKGRRKSIQYLFERFKEMVDPSLGKDYFIAHGDCLDDALALKDMIQGEFDMNEPVIEPVGMVIGSHSGPGTLGLFFLGKAKEDFK